MYDYRHPPQGSPPPFYVVEDFLWRVLTVLSKVVFTPPTLEAGSDSGVEPIKTLEPTDSHRKYPTEKENLLSTSTSM